ncbi:MAG TPA: pyridoxal-dependent decarboxylase [Actinocrinis sp.]|nr:pyridoxal-dependent decarboxylase [Actinocrinis sp.]
MSAGTAADAGTPADEGAQGAAGAPAPIADLIDAPAGGPFGFDDVLTGPQLQQPWDQAPDELPSRPLPPGGPRQVAARVRERLGEVLPELGLGDVALKNIDGLLRAESVQSRHPLTVAHLHCPTLPVAVAADALVGELNPSMNSWDQSAAACVIEDELLDAVARLVYPRLRPGPDARTGGTVTTGGSESNLLALMFARDEAVRRHYDTDPAKEGLPGFSAGKLVVLCSAAAHFSVARAAAVLGLGEQAVYPIPVRADHGMDAVELARTARWLHGEGRRVVMVVGTAGTTDAGAIDPLGACAEVARRHGAWFHVDAAYGGPLLFSPRRAPRLDGIDLADSVSLDLHKFGWQPVPAGLLVTRTRDAFALAGRRVAYLSDLDDEQAGYPNLLGRSLRTTRRADAVKMVATMQALGRAGLAERIERCFDLTAYAAAALAGDDRFELAMRPAMTTVLFRYLPRHGDSDQVNAALRRRLLADGSAVVGRTRLPEIHSPTRSAQGVGRPGGPAYFATCDVGGWEGPGKLGAARAAVDPRATGRFAGARGSTALGNPRNLGGRLDPAAPGGLGRPGALRLKLALLNPDTRPADLDRLIELIAAAGAAQDALATTGPGAGAARCVDPDRAPAAESEAGPADPPPPPGVSRRDRQGTL